jgi:hypothetical protein
VVRDEAGASTKREDGMRLVNRLPTIARISIAFLTAGIAVFLAADARAWTRFHDHVYADSFGNLVIQSPSGYKRIVVGQGHLARQLSKYEHASNPEVVYLDEGGDGYDGGYVYRDCFRPPYLFKGRSYMYGLPDGVIPQAPCAN